MSPTGYPAVVVHPVVADPDVGLGGGAQGVLARLSAQWGGAFTKLDHVATEGPGPTVTARVWPLRACANR